MGEAFHRQFTLSGRGPDQETGQGHAQSAGYFPVFDGLRGVAFLLVLSFHATAFFFPALGPAIQGGGKLGVWLFFVLSAYLLTRRYLLSSGSVREYLIARFLRIVPLYWVAVATYVYTGVIEPSSDMLWTTLAVANGPIHMWTIPAEFWFYGFLLLLFPLANGVRVAAFAAAALFALCALLVLPKDPNSIFFAWYLPSFFVGFLVAHLEKIGVTARLACPRLAIAFPVLLGLSLPGVVQLLTAHDPGSYLMNAYGPISVGWGWFVASSIHAGGSILGKWLCSPVLVWFGKVSYSGYLFHWLAFGLVIRWIGVGTLPALCGIGLSLAVAFAMHRLIEMPLMDVRRKLLASKRPRASNSRHAHDVIP